MENVQEVAEIHPVSRLVEDLGTVAHQVIQEDFDRLWEPIQGFLLNFARGLTDNPDDAEDLLQDTAVKAWKGFPRFKPDPTFKAWVCKIMTNIARDEGRKRKRRIDTVSLDGPVGEDANGPITVVDPVRVEEQVLTQEELRLALDKLTPQELLIMQFTIEGLEDDEIADCLGTTKRNVETQRSRARGKLRQFLSGWRA